LHCRERRKTKKGFTLLEVIVGVFIIALLGVAFLVMFSSACTAFFTLGRQTAAVNEAQSFIESFYSTTAMPGSEWQVLSAADSLDGDLTTVYTNKTKFYKVEDITGEPVDRLTVVVYYNQNSKRVQVSALVP